MNGQAHGTATTANADTAAQAKKNTTRAAKRKTTPTNLFTPNTPKRFGTI